MLYSCPSVYVKYKIFLSAMEYLPFSPGDDSKASFEEIIERYLFVLHLVQIRSKYLRKQLLHQLLFVSPNRVLSRSREIRIGKHDESSDIVEQHRLQSLQKAMVIQWLCFTPPSTVNDLNVVSAQLLLRAVIHR